MASELKTEPSSTEELDTLDPSSVIVFHPGSMFLRVGRASDSYPIKILHAIARRRKTEEFKFSDSMIVPRNPRTDTFSLEGSRQKLMQQLQKSIRSDGRKRQVPPSKKIAELNAAQQPNIVTNPDEHLQWLDTKSDFVVGDDVLDLHPDAPYNIHFPFKRGDINVHDDVGGSKTAILANLETIWTTAVENHLGIPRRDFCHFKAVIVIPALYKRDFVKHYMSLALGQLGFGHTFVLQDHVAATFGAGLGYACIVDVGDQKTSVSCVEDGISHPDTRMHLDYGGSDITQVFYYLLEQSEFPYKNCNLQSNFAEIQLLENLKIDNCHLDLDICGTAEKTFLVKEKGKEKAHQYTVYLSDECILAPMAYFQTELLELTRPANSKGIRFMGINTGDSEDPHDNIYLSETSRKYTKAGDTNPGDPQGDPDTSQVMDDELDILNEDSNYNSKLHPRFNEDTLDRSLLISLDQAILRSIESCSSDEVKKKMYSSIVLVGGGIRFNNINKFLTQKLALQVPPIFRQDLMEVQINPKGMSSEDTTWRGAAILSCLGSAQELWISPKEWNRQGQKLLREKAPFPWA